VTSVKQVGDFAAALLKLCEEHRVTLVETEDDGLYVVPLGKVDPVASLDIDDDLDGAPIVSIRVHMMPYREYVTTIYAGAPWCAQHEYDERTASARTGVRSSP